MSPDETSFGKLGNLGATPKVLQMLKEGYTLPFQTRSNLTRSPNIISCYVYPHRNLCLLEALHQLMNKNAVELVKNQESLDFYNRLFFGPKTKQQVETYTRSQQPQHIPQGRKILNGDTRNNKDLSPDRGVGIDFKDAHRLQGSLLPHTNFKSSPGSTQGFMSRVKPTSLK